MTPPIKYVGKTVEVLKPLTVESGGKRRKDAPRFTPEQVRALAPVFRFLNAKDLDILFLIFGAHKRQMDVTRILHRTQSSLAYDIKRIKKRLVFIRYLHQVFDIFMNFVREQADGGYLTSDEMDILVLMFYTSSFSLAARVLRTSPVKVRHAYTKCLKKMETKGDWEAFEIFTIIRFNLNIVKRLCRCP